ncbi:hypothetical protein D4764_02G0011000 [Takifugu flavidus]|uniref:Uncharacterized protein n=1 Tax=Takifugu flavidus TaxID=433684 RepID=A0A5C6NN32_9TELE|nr:hypothetical protein D4764_02G0011000 [Takifugu flavidus]
MVWPFTYLVLPPPSGELSEDVEAASETTTDQEDQTKDRESGGEKELTKGTGHRLAGRSIPSDELLQVM